jgi:hypothetical protein
MGDIKYQISVNVVGRASKRWKGAKNAAEAASKNRDLSLRRAMAVSSVIAEELRKVLGNTDVTVTLPTPVVLTDDSVPIQFRGLGSENPIISEPPSGDLAINRTVLASLSWHSSMPTTRVKARPTKYRALSNYWGFQKLKFEAAALGKGKGLIRFRLLDMFGKSRKYEAELTGHGYDNPLSGFSDKSKLKVDDPNPPQPIFFQTREKIGFEAFENNNVIVKKLQVGVGVPTKKIPLINKIPIVKDLGASVSDTFFGFSGLGGTSDSLLLDFAVDWGVDYGGFIMQGKTQAIEANPGNWQDGVEYYDENGIKINQGSNSMMVFFETGKSAVVGKQEADVRHWSNNWAQNFKVLKSM